MPLGQGAVRHLCAVGASRAPRLTELSVGDPRAVGGSLDRADALRRLGRWTKREVDDAGFGRPSLSLPRSDFSLARCSRASKGWSDSPIKT